MGPAAALPLPPPLVAVRNPPGSGVTAAGCTCTFRFPHAREVRLVRNEMLRLHARGWWEGLLVRLEQAALVRLQRGVGIGQVTAVDQQAGAGQTPNHVRLGSPRLQHGSGFGDR